MREAMKWNQNLLSKHQKTELTRNNQINQQRDIILPDTFGLEDYISKHELNDMKYHELRDDHETIKTNKSTLLV